MGLVYLPTFYHKHQLNVGKQISPILWDWNSQRLTTKQNRALCLVGGWTNPSEKYARQIGSFPQIGMNIKKIFETTNQL